MRSLTDVCSAHSWTEISQRSVSSCCGSPASIWCSCRRKLHRLKPVRRCISVQRNCTAFPGGGRGQRRRKRPGTIRSCPQKTEETPCLGSSPFTCTSYSSRSSTVPHDEMTLDPKNEAAVHVHARPEAAALAKDDAPRSRLQMKTTNLACEGARENAPQARRMLPSSSPWKQPQKLPGNRQEGSLY